MNLRKWTLAGMLALGVTSNALAQADKETSQLMYSEKINASLKIQGRTVPVTGHFNMVLNTKPGLLRQGSVEVEMLTLALSNIDQEQLSGKKPKGKKSGILGMTTFTGQRLRYNPQTKKLDGVLKGGIDFPQLSEMSAPGRMDKDDNFQTAHQPSVLKFSLSLAEGLENDRPVDHAKKIKGKLDMDLTAGSLAQYGIRNYDLSVSSAIDLNRTWAFYFELGKSLCLQPVRIKSSSTDASPTGAGLSFGMPEANRLWGQADIVFSVRPWKEIVNSGLKVASEGAEETQIRSSVEDDDCIEVFFVQNFSPVDLHGGGATWGRGTASAQIISSDGNAVNGVDFVHLGHELGHVLNLRHPGQTPNPGNTGTLMCPSGWNNDNPAFNSVANKTNISNPLLKLTIKKKGAAPDCNNNADCGPCT